MLSPHYRTTTNSRSNRISLEKVDEYAESYNRLEQLDKEFPDKLKKSILQYAMQGN
ncbi:type I restriction-modification system subunit S [Streptococcus pneumoniae]|nr:type I restriction-modification system subunit S [Streptococcus pneumoniae]